MNYAVNKLRHRDTASFILCVIDIRSSWLEREILLNIITASVGSRVKSTSSIIHLLAIVNVLIIFA